MKQQINVHIYICIYKYVMGIIFASSLVSTSKKNHEMC